MEKIIQITTSQGNEHLINTRYIFDVSVNTKGYTMITYIANEVEPKYVTYYTVNESVNEIMNLINA